MPCSCLDTIADGEATWVGIISKDKKIALIEVAENGKDWETDLKEDESALFEDTETFLGARYLVDMTHRNWFNYKHPNLHTILLQ
jgi:hypothetical protein